jgi:hypothetical protein
MSAERERTRKIRILLILFLVGIIINLVVVFLVNTPGYMDAEYYYSGAQQLFRGNGFWEPFLWNYLDQPDGIPHPSHTYWMPLPSIISVGGMLLAGNDGFISARILFIPLAGLIGVITALIAWRLGLGVWQGTLAGGLALASGFYLPYQTLPESFSLYMVLGGAFFLTAFPQKGKLLSLPLSCLVLGSLAGLMHLSRADGLLWFFGSVAVILLEYLIDRKTTAFSKVLVGIVMAAVGYLLLMAPWYARNLSLYSRLMAPGGSKTIFLTNYNQTFVYPPDVLNLDSWLQAGWGLHFADRLSALKSNLLTTLGVQGLVVLLPLILAGAWSLRKERLVWVGFLAWFATLLVMTVVFPYSGARGGFFHSGSALQPLFWALVPAGLNQFIDYAESKKGWNAKQANQVFGASLLVICVLISGFLFSTRVLSKGTLNWDNTWQKHQKIGDNLIKFGASSEDIIVVNNPPGFTAASGFSSVVIPDGDEDTVLEVAKKYDARFLALDNNAVAGLKELYGNPKDVFGLQYLGTDDGVRYFLIILAENDR